MKYKETHPKSTLVFNSSTANLAYLVCKQYGKSLAYGTKYLYQSLPRMLTLWLDLGTAVFNIENEYQSSPETEKIKEKLTQTTNMIKKYTSRLPAYQFLTAIPQLISRICHKSPEVQEVLDNIIVTVLTMYPQQTLWHLMAVAKSTVKSRVSRISSIVSKVKVFLFNGSMIPYPEDLTHSC